jgi:ankyrin repeat protein
LLDSLAFKQIDTRKLTIKKAHAKTCRWLLDHPQYEAWLDHINMTQHHGFLWISGKPGAGKSTMMKFAYSDLKQKAHREHTLTASFFFNARGSLLEKSVSGMYRSLLLQLLQGYPDLQAVLDDPDLVSQTQSGCPCLNVLKELFCTAICSLGQRSFTCFIDALDECDEQQVVEMVQYFEDLAEQSTAKSVSFRICFSSRHYPYIEIERGIRLTLEDQPGHAMDLEAYVSSRLQIKEAALSEEIRSQLLNKAAGVFMWVVLVVDILNKEYRHGGMSMRKRLTEIPSDLSGLFKDILQRDNENMEALLLCILWILYAKRPLQLIEFYHALWAGLSLEGLVDDEIPDTISGDLDRYGRYVISSSKGLAETTKSKQPTVQFIHESVRDFLIKDNGLRDIWPELGLDFASPSHEKLKHCCRHYMNQRSVTEYTVMLGFMIEPVSDHRQSKDQNDKLAGREFIWNEFPFLEYASQHLLHHADAAASLVPQDKFLSSFLVHKWIKLNNLFEKFKNREYTENASLLYIFADKGFAALIRTLLKEKPKIHVLGERYRYPLFAALANGHKDCVAALLNLPSITFKGVDIAEGFNSRKDFKAYSYQTPLSWAAQTGHTGFVELLLQQNLFVDELDKEGRTPIFRAAKNGHEATVRLLIEKGAEVNNRDGSGSTLLSLALESGHEVMVRLLIEKGAAVNTSAEFTFKMLAWAIEGGREAIVKLLNNAGADFNAKAVDGQTPLALAAMYGHGTITRLLIEQGANVNTIDIYGFTPVARAVESGHEGIVRLLIEQGANVNTIDIYGFTPVARAVESGHEGIVRLLIKKGADFHTEDVYGYTPLRLAIMNGHEAIVKLLIEKGADSVTENLHRQTPIPLAAESGNLATVRLLVEKGADINANGIGNTPLEQARANGHTKIVDFLSGNQAYSPQ